MRRGFGIGLLIVLLLMAGVKEVGATHLMGADFTYKCLGNNQYEITFQLYRYCGGNNAPGSAPIHAVSACTGETVNATLSRLSLAEVTPLCNQMRACSDCNPAPPAFCPQVFPGVELHTYRGTITLPSQCDNWNVSWELAARNFAVTNLNVSSQTEMYVDLMINNENGLCNSSPVFGELPVPYICQNELHNYNHGLFDAEGDSIVYELIHSMEENGQPIPFANPYSLSNPMGTSVFSFDSITGQLTLIPDQQQQAVLTFRIKEYRDGVLIGQTIRDIQIIVLDCTNSPPELTGYRNVSGGFLIDSFTVSVCPGNTVEFEITGSDTTAIDSIFLNTNFNQVFGGGTHSIGGTHNPNTVSFSWTPTPADAGTRYFTVTAKDNECPTTSSTSQVYAIKVQRALGGVVSEKLSCLGDTIRITASGGAQFHWEPPGGIIDAGPDSSWILVSPSQSRTYTVSETNCGFSDTARVEIEPIYIVGSPDTLLCQQGAVPLGAAVTGPYPPIELDCGPNNTPLVNPVINYIVGENHYGDHRPSPFLNNRTDVRLQFLMRASELLEAGMKDGIITDIAIELVAKHSTKAAENFQIRIGCTGVDSLTDAFEPIPDIYYFNSAYKPLPGLNTFPLIVPYDWDGTSNLIVQMCWDNGQTALGGTDSLLVYDVNYRAMIRAHGNDSAGCSLKKPINTYHQLPKVIIGMAEPPETGQFNYRWTQLTNGSGTLDNDTIQNPVATPNPGITQYLVSVRTKFGCRIYDTVHVAVADTPLVDAGPDQSILLGQTANLNATGGGSYYWQPPTGLSDTTIANPEASPGDTTTYTVVVTDSNGCVGRDVVTVFVEELCRELMLPNAFTPNGDGLNDRFAPLALPGKQELIRLEVYNRWGELVFSSSDMEGWDGTHRGEMQGSGSFTYVVRYRCDGVEEVKTGNVVVVR